MKWGFRPHLCTYRLDHDNFLRMMRWHCPPDTGFEIRVLAVWGRPRYLSITEAPLNIEVNGDETFRFFETWRLEWGPNSRSPTFQAGSCNRRTRAPALSIMLGSPSKLETLTQCSSKVGSLSKTLVRHWSNIGSMYRVCSGTIYTLIIYSVIYMHITSLLVVLACNSLTDIYSDNIRKQSKLLAVENTHMRNSYSWYVMGYTYTMYIIHIRFLCPLEMEHCLLRWRLNYKLH